MQRRYSGETMDLTALRILLGIMTAFRLAELIVYDRGPWAVFHNIRFLVGKMAGRGGNKGFWYELAEGLNCTICVGTWMSLLVAVMISRHTVIIDFILLWLGISGAQSLFARAWKSNFANES